MKIDLYIKYHSLVCKGEIIYSAINVSLSHLKIKPKKRRLNIPSLAFDVNYATLAD